MIDQMLSSYLSGCRSVSRALTGTAWKQWHWYLAQYRLAARVGDAFFAGFTPVACSPRQQEDAGPQQAGGNGPLEQRIEERLAKGLAPPREIYDVRNRERIDWSRVPDWARAPDPEMFEGCGHEG